MRGLTERREQSLLPVPVIDTGHQRLFRTQVILRFRGSRRRALSGAADLALAMESQLIRIMQHIGYDGLAAFHLTAGQMNKKMCIRDRREAAQNQLPIVLRIGDAADLPRA